ncbi:hypothetical protein [Paraburkholderia hospita]|uniref:hypothetical protein n=1 Tax=Paraburkholderia hospita TaxID=169430 RepID=UPI003ECD9680
MWLTANSLAADWTEGARLRYVSIELANSIWAIELLRDARELALFDNALQLDYKSVIVRGIHDICAARLETWLFEK